MRPRASSNDFQALPDDVCRIARAGGRPDRFECGKLGAVISGGDRRSSRVSGERSQPATAGGRRSAVSPSRRSKRSARVGEWARWLDAACSFSDVDGRASRQAGEPSSRISPDCAAVAGDVLRQAAKWGSLPVAQSSKSRDDSSL